MKLTRVAAVLLVLVLNLGALPAHANADNPYWRVETNLPVATMQGDWAVTENGRSATVTFDGVNVVAQTTRFTAGWRTKWFNGWQTESGDVMSVADPFTEGDLRMKIRGQVKGQPWTGWSTARLPWSTGGGGYLWDAGAMFLTNKPVRFEWRMIGTIEGNAYVDGSVTISVD